MQTIWIKWISFIFELQFEYFNGLVPRWVFSKKSASNVHWSKAAVKRMQRICCDIFQTQFDFYTNFVTFLPSAFRYWTKNLCYKFRDTPIYLERSVHNHNALLRALRNQEKMFQYYFLFELQNCLNWNWFFIDNFVQ